MKPVVAPLRLLATLALLGLGVAVLGQVGCSNQSEGQRCSVDNNNDDCQENLICKPKDQLNGAQDSLCCPADSEKATAPACRPPGQSNAVPTPVDASTTDATTDSSTDAGDAGDGSTSDATTDSSTDASSDASSDAPEGG
jgi:hypothetical protein